MCALRRGDAHAEVAFDYAPSHLVNSVQKRSSSCRSTQPVRVSLLCIFCLLMNPQCLRCGLAPPLFIQQRQIVPHQRWPSLRPPAAVIKTQTPCLITRAVHRDNLCRCCSHHQSSSRMTFTRCLFSFPPPPLPPYFLKPCFRSFLKMIRKKKTWFLERSKLMSLHVVCVPRC